MSSFHHSRRWGQHFLIDKAVRDIIIDEAELEKEDTVVEVGVGEAVLTEILVQKAGRVIGWEIDEQLYRMVQEKLKSYSNLVLYREDFLSADLPSLLSPFSPLKLVSNIPYAISSPFFSKILESNIRWNLLILMVQREFGEKILQEKGSPLSVGVNLLYKVEKIKEVSPGSFSPPPAVHSLILKFTPLSSQIEPDTYKEIMRWVHFLFSQRRKKIEKLLRPKLGKEGAKEILAQARINPEWRAEDLMVEHWMALSSQLRTKNND
ncbi:MAG TPA: 16S rRNA (adenine(1518)-N(6)/adenine(1519)-N(6))-dimethyltransferase RsmA [Candidatus Atribacteria bacterium]|nr:16S rRNA (adenine(1518)-N(6)/adenine(1519)-N(6))-dimethyltransferase RsmA [Candidatus Atribacteria bacterium]